jgi:hypothetical protein
LTVNKRASAREEDAVIERKTEAKKRALFTAVEITATSVTIISRAVAVPLWRG